MDPRGLGEPDRLPGAVDVALGSGPGLGFRAKGVPAIGMAAMYGPPSNLALTVLARSQSPAIKNALRASTEEAERLGIFGAPSFVTGGELFWGNDRLEQALSWAKRG